LSYWRTTADNCRVQLRLQTYNNRVLSLWESRIFTCHGVVFYATFLRLFGCHRHAWGHLRSPRATPRPGPQHPNPVHDGGGSVSGVLGARDRGWVTPGIVRDEFESSRVHVGQGIFLSRPHDKEAETDHVRNIGANYESPGGRFILYETVKELFAGVWLTGPIKRAHAEKNWGVRFPLIKPGG